MSFNVSVHRARSVTVPDGDPIIRIGSSIALHVHTADGVVEFKIFGLEADIAAALADAIRSLPKPSIVTEEAA